MRYAILAAALTVTVGCEEFNKIGEEKRQPAAPPGIAVPGGGGGVGMQAPAQPQAGGQPAQNAAAAPPRKSSSIIGKTTAEVIDLKSVRDDPNIQRVGDQKLNITDPVSGAGTLYFRMAGQTSSLGMQSAVKLYQAEHEKFPSLDEFKKMMKEYNVEFAKLRPYEMYGYDEDTGELTVLQDLKLKAEIYAKYGLDPKND